MSYNSPVSKLWVHWGTDPVATPAGFDMDAFAAVPALNDPEFEARLKGELLDSPRFCGLVCHVFG